jgi:hypothetical protein
MVKVIENKYFYCKNPAYVRISRQQTENRAEGV